MTRSRSVRLTLAAGVLLAVGTSLAAPAFADPTQAVCIVYGPEREAYCVQIDIPPRD